MSTYAIGVDLGGTTIKVGLVEKERGILKQATTDTEAQQGPDAVVQRIADTVAEIYASLPSNTQLAGVGIGAPGVISWDRTTIAKPPNFPGWDRVNLCDALLERVESLPDGCSVIVENDANVAGLGSAFYGAGRPFSSFIMVTLGTGVGGAIIYENRIFRGATGGAGEFGHMTIDYEGPYARSGVAGAIEAYLGHHFLSRHARYQLLQRTTRLHEMTGADLHDLTPVKLHSAAVGGDPAATELLAWAGHKLGVALGSAINLLDIRKVVVGGGVSAAGDYILGPARDAMRRFVMPGLVDDLELVRETLGNEAAILGAARLAFEQAETNSRHVFEN
ncbi:MAG: ROK family protein [Bacteroidota bacterium]